MRVFRLFSFLGYIGLIYIQQNSFVSVALEILSVSLVYLQLIHNNTSGISAGRLFYQQSDLPKKIVIREYEHMIFRLFVSNS